MDVAVGREALIEGLVAANGGDPSVRAFFRKFSDEELRAAADAVQTVGEQERRAGGRLSVIWGESRSDVLRNDDIAS